MPYLLLLFLWAVASSAAAQTGPAIQAYLPGCPPPDTLLFEVNDGTDSHAISGDTIPNALFFTTIPADLLREIDYLADSSQATVVGRQRFAWNDSIEVYWVDISQHWFKHQSLFLYHRQHRIFTDRVTVAEWYGGDGGQILTGTWLLDYDGNGQKDLLRREIAHSLVPEGEEVKDVLHESAVWLVWQGEGFLETPVKENMRLIAKVFPLRTSW